MKHKKSKIFNNISKLIVFRIADLRPLFDSDNQLYAWLVSMQETKHITKIRAGLYSVVDPTTGDAYADKFMIASAISKNSYISYHSALEFHGLANQVYNCVYVSDKKRFSQFEFESVEYIHNNIYLTAGVEHIKKGVDLKVTDIERTVIDCLHKLDLAGGIEEILHALDAIILLNEHKLLKYLAKYNVKKLYQKVGYVLSNYQRQFNLSDAFFKKCRQKSGVAKNYFLNQENLPLELHPEWQLIAPRFEILRKKFIGAV